MLKKGIQKNLKIIVVFIHRHLKMLLNPLKITNEVSEVYKRYLTTVFRLRDPVLRNLFFQEVEKFGFINGPLLEATPPFEKGCFLKDLIRKNILEKELEYFIYDSLPELN